MSKKTIGLISGIVILLVVFALLASYMSWLADNMKKEQPLKKFNDVRKIAGSNRGDLNKLDLSNQGEIIKYLRFNRNTIWPDKMPTAPKPLDILNAAKNPGLNVKKLHRSGITGKNVGIGLIDLPIFITHPEYKNAVKEYKEFGETEVSGSGLGSASLSILAGKDIGVAPDAEVYYAGVAADTLDVAYYYDAMRWFIDLNKKLPANKKIRIVVVPSAPDSNEAMDKEFQSPFEKNTELWAKALEEAKKAGIVVFDNTYRSKLGSCFLDFDKPDDFQKVTPGYPEDEYKDVLAEYTLIPTGVKTVAEEYIEGEYGYQYIPKTGINFTTPYAAGVVALGYQNNEKNLDFEKINKMLYDTSFVLKKGAREYRIINPEKYVEKTK